MRPAYPEAAFTNGPERPFGRSPRRSRPATRFIRATASARRSSSRLAPWDETSRAGARPCARRLVQVDEDVGRPRSPSYFGISYSRIRWSRSIVPRQLRDEPVILVEVRAVVRGMRSGETRSFSVSKCSFLAAVPEERVAIPRPRPAGRSSRGEEPRRSSAPHRPAPRSRSRRPSAPRARAGSPGGNASAQPISMSSACERAWLLRRSAHPELKAQHRGLSPPPATPRSRSPNPPRRGRPSAGSVWSRPRSAVSLEG